MIRALSVVVAAAVASAGCAQLAGLDPTTGKDRNVDTVAIKRLSIGSTAVSTDLDLTGLSAAYFVADATSPTGFAKVIADDGKAPTHGTWHADLPDPAPVQFTLPDDPAPVPRLFAFPDRALQVLFGVFEHPGRTPAPDGAMLTVHTPLETAATGTEGFLVYTVGAWSVHSFGPADQPKLGDLQFAPVPYAYSTSASTSGRPQLDRLTTQDTFLVLRYGAGLTGFAEATPFNQIGNDTVTTPTMTTVVQDQVLDVKLSPPTFTTRYGGARPAVGSFAMSWGIVATPGAAIPAGVGPTLQGGNLLPTDVGVTVNYGNPFAALHGWTPLFTLTTRESRVYAAPDPTSTMGGTLPVTLFAGMDQFLDLSPGAAPPPRFELTLEAGLPVTISIDGKPLLTDGEMIARPTRFVEVTFQSDKPTATLYSLQVFDLVPNTTPTAAATALQYRFVLAATAGEAKFSLPPDTFVPGHSYTIRAFCTSGGYPGASTGDFQTRTLPMSQSFLDSAVFTVMP